MISSRLQLCLCLLLLLGSSLSVLGEEAECSQEEQLQKIADSYRGKEPATHDLPYDIHNCPRVPPPNYPQQWAATAVMENWNHNDTNIPDRIHQGLCIFDYIKDYRTAMLYRSEDLPFIVRNRPEILNTVEKWHQDEYLKNLLNDPTRTYLMHSSESPNFLYWDMKKETYPENYVQPTITKRVTYPEYRELAANLNETSPYYYLFVEGFWSKSNLNFRWYLFDEFPMFKPDNTDMFNEVVHVDYQKLHCKFHNNQKGQHAVMHFDSGSNLIVVLQGQRRIVLADPTQCSQLKLRTVGHPSVRHTTVDFHNLDAGSTLQMNEVVMQPGDALYLPSYWFHDLTSLSEDVAQCSAWSTATLNHKHIIQECGSFGL